MTQITFTEEDRLPNGKLAVTPEEQAAAQARFRLPAPVMPPLASAAEPPAAAAAPPSRVYVQPIAPGSRPRQAAPGRHTHTPVYRSQAAGVVAGALALVAVLTLIGRLVPVPARDQAPPATGFANGESQLTPAATAPALTATPAATAPARTRQLTRAVVARWDYRDPDTATALEAGRNYAPTGQAEGGAWVLVMLESGREIWVPAIAVPDVDLAELPDLSPRPTPIPAPVYVPPPLVCGEYGTPGKMVQACGATQEEADTAGRELWKHTYGGTP